MKQNNFDAQQLYKEYMQTVNADPAAIGDILSGERQPVNHGAKIKHSTGKMATITAAAAVIAVCAGIGLSNMNANDTDSKVKSAASTVQTTKEQAPAKQDADFKTEVINTVGSKHGMCATIKLTGLTENGKKLIKEQGDKLTSDQTFGGLGVASMSFSTPIISDDSCTIMVSFVPVGQDGFEGGISVDMSLRFPSESEGTITDASRKVSFNISQTADEIALCSDSGEKMWLTDHYIATQHDCSDKEKQYRFTVKYKDGTKKESDDLHFVGGANRSDSLNYTVSYYINKLSTKNIESVTYDGIEFKAEAPAKQDENFKTEVTEMYCSDHSLRVTVKLTALNDEAKKMLKKYGSEFDTWLFDTKRISTGGYSTIPVITKDTYTTTLVISPVSNGKTPTLCQDGTVLTICTAVTESEQADFQLIPANRKINVTVKKNMTERKFRSASGETLWLSDYHFNCTHVPSDFPTNPDQSKKLFEINFADGTVKTSYDYACTGGQSASSKDEYPNSIFYFENKIDSSKVVSITYDGVEYTPQ